MNKLRRLAPLFEWALWVTGAGLAFRLSYAFDRPIGNYQYGATGWPRFVLIAIVVGASFQLLIRLRRNELFADLPAETQMPAAERASALRLLAIFTLPLVYLWLLPRAGFYLSTPFFLLAYLAALDVRGWRAYLGVTLTVYGLILLVFTRLFYVALPVGNWPGFYDINNAIVVMARAGLG